MTETTGTNGTIHPTTGPLRRTVTVVNPYGLHMRPATDFAELAVSGLCDVAVWKGDKRANGKSLWDLIGLCVMQNNEVILEVDGDGAHDVINRLADILAHPG